MRKSTQAIALTGASAVLFSTMALPASAAETADTPATMEVAAGSLSITAPTASVVLGAAIPGEATDSTALGDVTVTDLRAGISGWVASATVTEFTSTLIKQSDGETPASIPATAVAYTAPDATVTGSVAVAATSPSSIASSTAVQTATNVSGNNTATWSPSIVVTVPDQALAAADYAATFTHSVV